jgi:hypothetical protein
MSDALMSPHVHPREFDTELEAVWFSANYFYKESYVRGGESTGVVFWDPVREKFRITYRMDGGYGGARIRWRDVPKGHGFVIRAAWHTHIPGSRFCQVKGKMGGEHMVLCLWGLLSDSWLGEYKSFSGADREIADGKTAQTGRTIPIYLITADMIKRYTPGKPEKMWKKDIPSKMVGIWLE